MTDAVETVINGVELTLFAGAAAYSQLHQALFVADTHFGKDATFRHFGIPVPSGACDGTLRKLSELLKRTSARRLIVLGDLFHSRSSLSREVCDSMDSFLSQHPSLLITLVRGNHDIRVGKLPSNWPIRVIEPGGRIGRITLAHEPRPLAEDSGVLFCGHLHPSLHVASGRDSIGKLPCFWLSAGCLVFPAFGEFTGTQIVRRGKNDRAWVISDDSIIETF